MRDKTSLINQLECYRIQNLNKRGKVLPELSDSLVMAWIFHDNLLEGRSLNPEEIQGAILHEDQQFPSYTRPLLEDIRVYERAIDCVNG